MLEQLKLLFRSLLELILLILHPIFSVPIIIFSLVYYFKIKKYKEESYYKITHVSYFKLDMIMENMVNI